MAEHHAENAREGGRGGWLDLNDRSVHGVAILPGAEDAIAVEDGNADKEQNRWEEEKADHGVLEPGDLHTIGPVGGIFGIDIEGDFHAGAEGFALILEGLVDFVEASIGETEGHAKRGALVGV